MTVETTLQRAAVTQWLLDKAKEVGFPVGDASSPVESWGWSGEPNGDGSTFTPWFVVTPLTAQQQRIPGSLGDGGTEWSTPYSVFIAGVSRKQTETLADRIATTLASGRKETITDKDGNRWKVQKVKRNGIGSINKVGSALPDHYTQNDNYDLWISKERN